MVCQALDVCKVGEGGVHLQAAGQAAAVEGGEAASQHRLVHIQVMVMDKGAVSPMYLSCEYDDVGTFIA